MLKSWANPRKINFEKIKKRTLSSQAQTRQGYPSGRMKKKPPTSDGEEKDEEEKRSGK